MARQLRLRDMAGLSVIDFIDMEQNGHVRKVEKAMKDALKNDRARIQVGRISSFGLLEMSRQRLRTGVLEASTHSCPHCDGTGLMRTASSSGLSALRMIEDEAARGKGSMIVLCAGRDTAIFLLNKKRAELAEVEARYGVTVEVEIDEEYEGAKMRVESKGPKPDRRVVNAPIVDPEPYEDEDEIEEEDLDTEGLDNDADDEQDDDDRPKRRRRRRGGRGRRRGGRGRSEQRDNDGDGNDQGPDQGDDADEEAVEDKPKRSRRRTKADDETDDKGGPAATEGSDDAASAVVEEEKPKTRRRPRAKAKDSDADTSEAQAEEKPKPRRSRAKKAETEPEATAPEAGEKPKPKRSRAKKTDDAPKAKAKPRSSKGPKEPALGSATKAAGNEPEAKPEPAKKPDPAPEKAEPATDEAPRRGWWQRTFG